MMIRSAKIIPAITFMVCFSVFTIGQDMEKPFLLKSGNQTIDCSPPYAAPLCMDYDNDGLQDLIVGTFRGEFRYYKNVGTKNTPVYNEFELLQADGKNAIVKNW